MAITLYTGGEVSLAELAPGLSKVVLGLGWERRASDDTGFELDASAFLLRADGKVGADADLVFYNNLVSSDGSVEHGGRPAGAGAGDEERLLVDLARVRPEVARIVVAVTIGEADAQRLDFGMVGHACIRCLDGAAGREIARYELAGEGAGETAMIFGELYRGLDGWRFRAVGQGYRGGLGPLARVYGVDA